MHMHMQAYTSITRPIVLRFTKKNWSKCHHPESILSSWNPASRTILVVLASRLDKYLSSGLVYRWAKNGLNLKKPTPGLLVSGGLVYRSIYKFEFWLMFCLSVLLSPPKPAGPNIRSRHKKIGKIGIGIFFWIFFREITYRAAEICEANPRVSQKWNKRKKAHPTPALGQVSRARVGLFTDERRVA
jgi:hypothetical protein